MNFPKCLFWFVLGDIDDPKLRPILKYLKHPSILAIKERCKKLETLSFTCD